MYNIQYAVKWECAGLVNITMFVIVGNHSQASVVFRQPSEINNLQFPTYQDVMKHLFFREAANKNNIKQGTLI